MVEASRGTDKARRGFLLDTGYQAPYFYIFSGILEPALKRSFEENLRDRAYLRAAQVVLAIERYRLEHGVLPENVSALVPDFLTEIPSDPFTDAPLLYRRLETGYAVYSVGSDAEDDGGIDVDEKQPGQSWRDLDYAVKVARSG